MNLEFIASGPALLVRNVRAVLVIADLHLGIESDLARHGLYFKSRSVERQDRVLACIDETSPDLLILLGDVKHMIPLLSRQEYRELPEALDSFRERVPFKVVPGNHDIGLDRFLEPGELLPKEGTLIEGVGYMHGHTCPSPDLAGHLIIAGHHHPLVSLRDEVGCSLRAPAYLYASLDDECSGFSQKPEGQAGKTRVLFMPAFNELSGYDITRIVHDPFSPLSRCMKKESIEIFLTDGTLVGPLSSVEEE